MQVVRRQGRCGPRRPCLRSPAARSLPGGDRAIQPRPHRPLALRRTRDDALAAPGGRPSSRQAAPRRGQARRRRT